MIKRGFSFEFEVPENWNEFTDRTQMVFQGPNHEELIISGWIIRGGGSNAEKKVIREQLFQNAVESVNSAAEHPELRITKHLQKEFNSPQLERWDLSAETHQADTLFNESIFVSNDGVLLITFEAPNSPSSRMVFSRFINTVSVYKAEAEAKPARN